MTEQLTVVEEKFTCEDVLGDNLHLHFQGMLGGVGDLSGDVRNLADEHWGHKFRLLHPNQSSHTVFLHKNEIKYITTFFCMAYSRLKAWVHDINGPVTQEYFQNHQGHQTATTTGIVEPVKIKPLRKK